MLEGAPETENLVESQTTEGSAPVSDVAPESSAPEITNLDKLEKFTLNGEEWTREKLASAMLRQADYTRKTQQLSQERKYYENLYYDVENVKQNPALIEQFKKVYPQSFHQYVDKFAKPAQTDQSKAGAQSMDPQFMAEFNQMKNQLRQQEVQAASVVIDGIFKKNLEKYPFADEDTVTQKALAIMEAKKVKTGQEDLTPSEWDKLFKSENDRLQKLAENRYKETINKQLKANKKGKDSAVGGGVAGQAPVRHTMKEATEAAIRDLTSRSN